MVAARICGVKAYGYVARFTGRPSCVAHPFGAWVTTGPSLDGLASLAKRTIDPQPNARDRPLGRPKCPFAEAQMWYLEVRSDFDLGQSAA